MLPLATLYPSAALTQFRTQTLAETEKTSYVVESANTFSFSLVWHHVSEPANPCWLPVLLCSAPPCAPCSLEGTQRTARRSATPPCAGRSWPASSWARAEGGRRADRDEAGQDRGFSIGRGCRWLQLAVGCFRWARPITTKTVRSGCRVVHAVLSRSVSCYFSCTAGTCW